ncbi:MAG: dipicolinate synthase subunit DpsA [Ruminococcaceae bacterium]|nr:dipicolinate synthase subunit DpsA [Oscillospiraceae bacterium]
MKCSDENIKIAVIGGDLRQVYTATELANNGYEVAVFGFENFTGDIGLCTRASCVDDALNKSRCVVLPMPLSNDGKMLFMPFSDIKLGLCDLFSKVSDDIMLFGGRVGDVSEKYGVKIEDYFEREELVIANAYLTAESAVSIASNEMKESLRYMSVLVMGYGRIGKALCHLLKGMGANVYASARKNKDFEWIRAFGYSPIDTSKVCDVVASCRLIFNTIPKLVLGEDVLCCLQKDCLVIDLASKPGGVDFEAAKKCGLKTLWALGLPGKKLPISAGRVQARVILDMLEDEGVI